VKTHLILIVFSVFVVETINFSKLFNKFKVCILTIKKVSKTILSKNISDHWKEKSLLKYSQQLVIHSMRVLGILLLILLLYFIISFLYQPFSNFLISIHGIIETTIIALIYIYLKKLIYAKL